MVCRQQESNGQSNTSHKTCEISLRNLNGNELVDRTCTLDSGRLIFIATSSRIKMSGYLVFENKSSRISSCALVNVVRSLRCLRGGCPVKQNITC